MYFIFSNDLVIFVSFSCDDHNFTCFQVLNRVVNCLSPVAYHSKTACFILKYLRDVADNSLRLLFSRIIRSDD